MKKERGSAIIIAIMIVTAIGTVSFYFGRNLVLSATSHNLVESGIGAYYAAESGLEEALLRQVKDANQTVPLTNWTPGNNMYVRSSMSNDCGMSGNVLCWYDGDANTDGVASTSTGNLKADQQSYDLRMGQSARFYGHDVDEDGFLDQFDLVNTGYSSDYLVAQNTARTISVKNIYNTAFHDVDLYFHADIPCPEIDIELTHTVTIPGFPPITIEQKPLVRAYDPSQGCAVPPGAAVIALSMVGSTFKIPSLGFEIMNAHGGNLATGLENASLKITPRTEDMKIGLVPTTNTDWIATPRKMVKSVGHYGGVTRSLRVNIDPNNNWLYYLSSR
jgi:hypothetical protein